jgi:uncharacterized protein YutE (UPF0331/DUF86 family)/predicted nucleotidyltransferase
MIGLKEKMVRLQEYFSDRSDVSMAFLFGSYATGRFMPESDLDIAVYFKPEGREVEWEETGSYGEEDQIWRDLERIAGVDTDLVVLNRAPATLAASILGEGIPIVIKNRALYLRLFLQVSEAAESFREFTRDFWAIKQRSASLTDADRGRLIRIADFLEAELRDLPGFADLDKATYENDPAVRRNVERWVENIVNACIEIAKILLAADRKRIPQTYREALEELAFLDGFDREAAVRLSGFAKLRNILAHEYIDIRFLQIRKFILESEPAYRALLGFVKTRVG